MHLRLRNVQDDRTLFHKGRNDYDNKENDSPKLLSTPFQRLLHPHQRMIIFLEHHLGGYLVRRAMGKEVVFIFNKF